LFVRKLEKDVFSGDLEKKFKEHGEILSCKVSINEDYTSRGYGFICYKDQESADKALLKSQN
jgi:polyadenylate-binding protein